MKPATGTAKALNKRRTGVVPAQERTGGRARIGSFGIAAMFVVLIMAAWTAAATFLMFSGNRLANAAVARAFQLQDFYEQQGAEYKRVVAAARAESERLARDLERAEALAKARTENRVDGQLIEIARRQSQIETRQSSLLRLAEQVSGAPAAALRVSTVPLPVARPANLAERTRSVLGGETEEAPAVNLDPDADDMPLDDIEDNHGALQDGELGTSRAVRAPAAPLSLSEKDTAEVLGLLRRRVELLEKAQVDDVQSLARATASRAALLKNAAEIAGKDLADIVEPVKTKAAAAVITATRRTAEDTTPFGVALNEVRSNTGVIKRLSTTVNRLPIRRPVSEAMRTTSRFGPRSDPFLGTARLHAGQDFATPIGTPVRSTGSGVVLSASWGGGYGNLVQVDHGGGLVTRYAHLSEITVIPGQPVSAGDVVGKAGSTGRSTGPHLHYETRLNSVASDPMRLMRVGEQLTQLGTPLDIKPRL